MPSDDPLANAVETFAAPIEGLIVALGQGVAEAQRALDQNSVQTQEKIDSDPVLSQYGLQATWYQFPSVNLQLKLSLAIAEDQTSTPSSGTSSPSLLRRLHLVAQPVSASFQTHFNYDAQAATQINLTMVPVPPPKAADQSPPKMTQAAVQAAALASPAPFVTVTDAHGNKTPAGADGKGNTLVFDMNFNAVARIWYVIQYAPSNAAVVPVVVAVDDATASVRVISTP
ncbi:MAG TPA: hypothetical protein VJV74_06480 [Terriglobia bacterium]|nr:hypothetical protein [Terriglobia bacterium]